MDLINKIRIFFNNYRKILFILFFLAVIVFFTAFLYRAFIKPSPATGPETGTSTTTSSAGLPGTPVGPGQIVPPSTGEGLPAGEIKPEASLIANGSLTQTTKLSDSPVAGLTLNEDGDNLQYYDKNDGKFYKIDSQGETTLLSDKVFHDVETVSWNRNKEKAILEYPDGANIVYDFSKNKQVTLPKHWEDFDFSPTSDDIVAKSIGLDPGNRWLIVTSDDGSSKKPIEAIGENADIVTPSWSPNNQTIAMYIKGVSFNRQELFFVGLNNENFKSTIIQGRGFMPLWSPQGDRLLYSVYSSDNAMRPSLWIVEAQGQNIGSNRKNLRAETWANKCVFKNSNTLICAIPDNLPEGAGLFPELAENSHDNLYYINTETANKKLLAVPEEAHNMSNLTIVENEQFLFFTDNLTQKIYKIRLY